MFHRSRKISVSIIAFGLLSTACSSPSSHPQDRKVAAAKPARASSPETRPEWANDQPEYMKPTEELTPQPTARATDPLHYFTNQHTIMVRQPGGYDDEQTPRVALWSTDDNGYNWKKQGFFGRGQSHFALHVKGDGDYGIRFVGPGQEPANEVPANPVRMYHVDSCPPEVDVSIEPEQTWYNVGDTVTISWRASDSHLVEFPVRIGMMMDFTADDGQLIELQRDLAEEGSLSYVLPQSTFDHEVWFRVEALDRANNMGIAYSYALQVVDTNLAATEELKEEVNRVSSAGNVTPQDANAMLARAASEYESLVDVVTTAMRDVSLRGEEIRRRQADPEADRTAAGDEAPVYGRIDSSEVAATELSDKPCDDIAIEETPEPVAIRNETEIDGPMSDASGPLPYATAASREVMDAPVENTRASLETGTADSVAISTPTAEAEVFEAQSEPFSYEQPVTSEAIEETRDMTSYDPTCGNGLMVPFPATVESTTAQTAHAHPWRALGARRISTLISDNIWTLPGRRTNFGWHVEFEGRFVADNPSLRNIALPPSMTPTYADVEADMEGLPNQK